MRFDASAKMALIVAAATLVVCGIGFTVAVGMLNVYLEKEPVPLRGPLARIPVTLGPWQRLGEDGTLSAAVREALGTDQYLDRNYRLDAEGDAPAVVVALHIAYYTGMIDTVPHVPERCWGAAGLSMTEETFVMDLDVDRTGWFETDRVNRATGQRYHAVESIDPILRRVETVHMPIGDFAFRVTEFQNAADPDQRLIGGYLFIANGRLTSSALGVRSLAFQASERHAYYAKVQFSMPASGRDPNRFETYRAVVSDLMTRMLPHIMRQLPDWPSVEAQSDPAISEPQAASNESTPTHI